MYFRQVRVILPGMRHLYVLSCLMVVGGSMMLCYAQTTQPSQSAKSMLDDMLRPTADTNARPLQPVSQQPVVDKTSGNAAISPDAPAVNLLPEGSLIVDRVGRLAKASDGTNWEFHFESDGKALKDPPLMVLPNRNLMLMEDLIKETNKDVKFRITGSITDYRGRNYVLLIKAVAERN